MNTFNDLKEFFPTPPELVAKMICNIRFKSDCSVLEPSAGSGNIAKFIVISNDCLNSSWCFRNYEGGNIDEKCRQIILNDAVERYYREEKRRQENEYYVFPNSRINIDCVEQDKNLQLILKDYDFNVVGDDFLKFSTSKMYDYIIMNPPFSNGDEHLMKAIRLAEKNGGSQIVCLLNAETIRNPYSQSRVQLKEILDNYGATYEYVQDAFKNAERNTDVEVVIIKVTIPNLRKYEFDWSKLNEGIDDLAFEIPDECNELVIDDKLKQPVIQYQCEIELGKKLFFEYYSIKDKISHQFANEDDPLYSIKSEPIISLKVGKNDLADKYTTFSEVVNAYVEEVRYKYWYELLHKPFFMEGLPSSAKEEYFNEIQKLVKYEFSIPNICEVRLDILRKTARAIEDSIITLFDKFTYKHSMGCEKNIHYFNGWKSNNAFIINKKIVVPDLNSYDWYGRFNIDYETKEFLKDIEKIFMYFDADPTPSDLDFYCEEYTRRGQNRKCKFKYFDVDFFKKGTAHITFKDDELLKKFNIYGCMKKGWLPPSYGKKSYDEMAEEEKSVVDEFEGANEYSKVFANTENYIVFPESSVKMLSA